jgi:hypothetical protein
MGAELITGVCAGGCGAELARPAVPDDGGPFARVVNAIALAG